MSDEFLEMFKIVLEDIFPYSIDKDFFEFNTGTVGWGKALKITSAHFKRNDIIEYYDSLDWEEMDDFSYRLGELMIFKSMHSK